MTEIPAKMPKPIGRMEICFPGRVKGVEEGLLDSAAADGAIDAAATGGVKAVAVGAGTKVVPRTIGPVRVVSSGSSGAEDTEGDGAGVAAGLIEVLSVLAAGAVGADVEVVTSVLVLSAGAAAVGVGSASGDAGAGVENVQDISTRTRLSPSFPTIGTRVIVHVSVITPDEVMISCTVWKVVGPLYGASRCESLDFDCEIR